MSDRTEMPADSVSDPTRATTAPEVEYQAVCADGGNVTANVHLADAVKHAEAMDSNPNCSPHRVQRRTVTYGEWTDA